MNEPKINYFDVIKSTTVLELDSKLCTKIYDYKNTHDYYKAGSTRDEILKVQVPTLMVNALDDPICFKSSIPYVECLQNPNTVLATTNFGGHLGWYEGWFPLQKSWIYDVVLDWSQSVFDHHYAASKAIKLP